MNSKWLSLSLPWRLTHNAERYTLSVMIRSFADRETEIIFRRDFSRKLPQAIQQIAFRKLRMLNRAVVLVDWRVPPANRLEQLRGDRAGPDSIRMNDQWRICFVWHDGEAYEVEIVAYHAERV
jgi:proteic killer suppression protein